MTTESMNMKLDSSQARADLAALAKALDAVGMSSTRMQANFTAGIAGMDRSLKGAMGSMEKFAQVANMLNKIKVNGDGTQAVIMFAKAMSQVARAKEIEKSKLDSYRKFIEVGMQVTRLRIDGNAFAGIHAFTTAVDQAARARQVSPAKLKSWVDFIEVAARVQRLRFSPQTAASLTTFAQSMDAIARVRSLSPTKIASLKQFFDLLQNMKPMRYSQSVAKDLEIMASAAARAGAAFQTLPNRMRGIAPAATSAANAEEKLNRQLAMAPVAAGKANAGYTSLQKGLERLNHRFSITYQAGTLFTQLFATFTVGSALKGIYDTTVASQKLDKAMLFLTGSFNDAKKASGEYLALSNDLGMRALQNADAYSRFAISSKAIGANMEDVNKIFKATGLALTSVGASGQQWEYAMYGLSQAMAKGKVTSEEFNRQIGEQIPGNVAAGVRALSKLEGKQLTANDLFARMKQGAIQSLPFFRAWADEIEKMFQPLLPVAEKRPDFQLNRLLNVWDRFKISVGNNGFIGEVTHQFKRLADMFIEGAGAEARLTEQGEKLSKTLGRNLGDMVRALGDGLVWVANNMDTLLAGLKGLLALGVVSTLNSWSNSLSRYLDKQLQATAANFKRAESERAVTTATAQSAAATASAAGSAGAKQAVTAANSAAGAFVMAAPGSRVRPGREGPLFGPSASATRGAVSAAELRAAGMTGEYAGFFGRRETRPNPRFTAQTGELFGNPGRSTQPMPFGRRVSPLAAQSAAMTAAAAGISTPVGAAATAANAASTVASASAATKAAKAFSVLRGALNVMPGVAMAAVVALALFSDKLTGLKTAAGSDILVKDIAGGAFDVVGKSVMNFFHDLGTSLEGLLGVANGKISGKSLGEWLAMIATGFIAVGKAIFGVAQTFGIIVGTILGQAIENIGATVRAMDRLRHGDVVGAGRIIGDRFKGEGTAVADAGRQVAKIFTDALDVKGIYGDIMAGANASADKRNQADQASAQAKAADLAIEAALKTREAADKQAAAAADLAAAARDFKGDVVPNYDVIRGDIEALIKGLPTSAEVKQAATAGTQAAAQAAASAPVSMPAAQAATHGGPTVPSDYAMSTALYATAESLKGLKENNAGDRTSLMNLFSGAGINLDPAKTAWCAAFINAMLSAQGAPQSGSQLASSFKNYGQEVNVKDAQKGDIVVLKPQAAGASGHVALFDSMAANGRVNLLGGNQRNQVGLNSFRASDIVAVRRAPNADASTGGGMGGGAAAGNYESQVEKRQNAYTTLQNIIGQMDAGAAAQAEYVKSLEKIGDLIQGEVSLRTQATGSNLGFNTIFSEEDLKRLDRWQKIQLEKIQDAINPLGKINRLAEQNLKIQEMAAKGRADEAAWMEQINQLTNDHVDLSKIDLDAEKKRFMAVEARKRQIQAEIDLTKALNDITVEQISSTGTRRDSIFAGLVSSKALEGERYGDTLSRLRNEGSLPTIAQQANAQNAQAGLSAQQGVLRDLVEMQAMAGLSGRQRNQRADFKSYLEEITGLSGTLNEVLAKSSDSEIALARRASEIKDAFDNPPGFQRWVQGLEPLSERLQQIKGDFMDGLGSGITDALMGEDVDWTQMARDLSKKVLRAQVDNALSGLVGLFTGKRGGPAATPEAQALMDVSETMRSAAERAASTSTMSTEASSQKLTMSANDLTSAATELKSAATELKTAAQPGGAAGGGASAVTTAASTVADAATTAAKELADSNNTIAELVVTGKRTPQQQMVEGLPIPEAIQGLTSALPDVSNMTSGDAGSMASEMASSAKGIFSAIGPVIQAAITGSMMKRPKDFQSYSAYGNSFDVTPAQTNEGRLAGITSMLNTAFSGSTISAGGPMSGTSTSNGGGGLFSGIGNFFGNLFGGGSAASTAASGGSSGGFLSSLFGGGSAAAGGASTGGAGILSRLFGKGNDGQYNGAGGFLGQLFGAGNSGETRGNGALSLLGIAGALLGRKKQSATEAPLDPINGVIGEHRGVNITGTAIAGHSNPIADILNLGLNLFTGGFGAGGGMSLGKTFANMGSSMASFFKEGGYSDTPVSRAAVPPMNWANVPHYAEGTPNTSGGMPAMLHPNEAVIPLSRGRSIPVDLGGQGMSGGTSNNVSTNITIVAPNPDAFRRSQGAISRQTNRDMKRAAARNLTP